MNWLPKRKLLNREEKKQVWRDFGVFYLVAILVGISYSIYSWLDAWRMAWWRPQYDIYFAVIMGVPPLVFLIWVYRVFRK
jgi:hypothetical protein